jgi:Protein of unknown function (DUF2867)
VTARLPAAAHASRPRGQLAVQVKPNGWFGKAYLAAIAPFRHRLVYPAMLRQIGEAWQPVP